MGVLSLCVRLVLSAVFLVAASGKLATPWRFAHTVELVGIPRRYARAGGYGIAATELALGVGLALGVWPRVVALCAIGLLVLFAAVALYAAWARLSVSCNCFGETAANLGPGTALRCLVLAVLAAAYALLPNGAAGWPASPDALIPLLGIAMAATLAWRWTRAVRAVETAPE
jgi:uncharacterized membrane protein YphA (DoxX/SURF4 family)